MPPPYRAALDRFKSRFGHDAEDGMLGYNAVMLFAEGAKNAGRNLTPQTLTAGLEKIKNFKTVFDGPAFTFGPGDHSPPHASIMMQVKGGKFVRVPGT